jgi:putative aldouronate transport system permease protein
MAQAIASQAVSKPKKRKIAEPGFEFAISVVLVCAMVATFIPIFYVFLISLSPKAGDISPSGWNFEAYKTLIANSRFYRALLNSILITLGGVTISVIMTVMTAYPLSRANLPGRQFFMVVMLAAFLFGAGLIPGFMLVKGVGLYGTWWSLWLPVAISVYNTFVMKAFFQGIPPSLIDAAEIDGASEWQILTLVVLPLSTPILLTVGMFYGVGYWNDFFAPILYLNKDDQMPLPVLLRDIITGASGADFTDSSFFSRTHLEALKMAAVFLTMLPMLIVYPWIQRHFTKGVLLGSVKE